MTDYCFLSVVLRRGEIMEGSFKFNCVCLRNAAAAVAGGRVGKTKI